MRVSVSLKVSIEPQYSLYTLSLSLGKTPVTLLISVWDTLSDVQISFSKNQVGGRRLGEYSAFCLSYEQVVGKQMYEGLKSLLSHSDCECFCINVLLKERDTIYIESYFTSSGTVDLQ